MTVAFDQLTVNSADGGAVTTLTINSTSAGNFRLAHIFLSGANGTGGSESVTVGGAAATKMTGFGTDILHWYFINPPTASTAYVATWPTATRAIMYVVTLNGVRQSSPNRQELADFTGAGATASTLTFTSSVSGDMIVSVLQKKETNEDIVPGASQTERSDAFYANNVMRQALSTKPVTVASEPMSYTWATGNEESHKGACWVNAVAAESQVQWFFFKRMQDFTRDLKAGLIPPHELRRRYGDLVTI